MSDENDNNQGSISYLRTAEMVFGTPLLIGETQGLIIGKYLSSRMRGENLEPQGNRFVGNEEFSNDKYGRKSWKGYRKEGSTAIVSLLGETVNRGAWMGSYSGMTSYEGLATQLKAAVDDNEVDRIVLDVNSPGGQTHGLAETSRLIRSLSKQKPITAVVNATAFSAAYILISGATKIVATESSELGSIGVLLIHADYSDQMKEAGVKVTMFHEGDRKIDLNPYEEVSEEAAKAVKSRMTDIMSQAVSIVSEHRNIPEKRIYSLEAGILSAQEAIKAGLADEIGTFDEVLANIKSADRGSKTVKRRSSMSDDIQDTDTVTKATYDNDVAKAKNDGAASATARFSEIMANDDIKNDANRIKAAFDLAEKSPSMSASDVCAFVIENVPAASEQKDNSKSLANRSLKPDSLALATGSSVGGDVEGPKASSHARDVMKKLNKRR